METPNCFRLRCEDCVYKHACGNYQDSLEEFDYSYYYPYYPTYPYVPPNPSYPWYHYTITWS